jgi:hypothetical protein
MPSGTAYSGSNASLSALKVTTGKNCAISVAAVTADGTAISLSGTYSVDKNKVITFDCGDKLVYKGQMSNDGYAISFISATGTYATFVDGLFLEGVLPDVTRVTSYENMTADQFRSIITVDRDLNNSGTWTTVQPADNADLVSLEKTNPHSGFASACFSIDTTASKIGKYRYRYATNTSIGKFSNVAFYCKNTSTLDATVYLYACTTAGTSASGRTQTGVNKTLTAGSDWTLVTASLSGAANKDIYGFSFFITTKTASSTDIVTGDLLVDDIYLS